jgi:hypothetical protein
MDNDPFIEAVLKQAAIRAAGELEPLPDPQGRHSHWVALH